MLNIIIANVFGIWKALDIINVTILKNMGCNKILVT